MFRNGLLFQVTERLCGHRNELSQQSFQNNTSGNSSESWKKGKNWAQHILSESETALATQELYTGMYCLLLIKKKKAQEFFFLLFMFFIYF